jgi:Flp pilus assembly protein TadG
MTRRLVRGIARKRPRRGDSRGAAAVELALIAPVLFALVFGMIDFGYAINRDTLINNASREGAREGSLNPNAAAITAVARAAAPTLTSANISVNVTCRKASGAACAVGTNAASGDVVVVRVSYPHSWLTPVGRVFGNQVTLTRTAEMRIE